MATVQTSAKRIERRRIANLSGRNRLACWGKWRQGWAYEIRNPLGRDSAHVSIFVRGFERIGRQSLAAGEENFHGGVHRLEALVSQVLQFTREITG